MQFVALAAWAVVIGHLGPFQHLPCRIEHAYDKEGEDREQHRDRNRHATKCRRPADRLSRHHHENHCCGPSFAIAQPGLHRQPGGQCFDEVNFPHHPRSSCINHPRICSSRRCRLPPRRRPPVPRRRYSCRSTDGPGLVPFGRRRTIAAEYESHVRLVVLPERQSATPTQSLDHHHRPAQGLPF
jgi:hypothetical protein